LVERARHARSRWPPFTRTLSAVALLAGAQPQATAAQALPSTAPPGEQAPEPELHPPRLIAPADLVLPEGVQAPEGGVDVVLSIDAQGEVTDVEPPQSLGEAGDAAVIQASHALRFEPARRGDQPIAARVRFRFELAQEAPEADAAAGAPEAEAAPEASAPESEAALAAPEPSALAEPAGDEALGATARIGKREPGAASRVKLRGAELTMIPGTFGEPLRVVSTLPGVAHTPYGLGFFLVRGASFHNTGLFVDGYAVPLLYHVGVGPAIISSRLVEQLDFYAGGYPVSFGRYTAGIVSLQTAPPPTDRLQLEVEVDLLRASGLVIVPFAEGKGSVALAFRRSYYELLLPLVTDDVELAYTDYQLRLDYRLSDELRASLFLFGARDRFETQKATGAGATTGQTASGLHYDFDQLIGAVEWTPLPEVTLRWSGTISPSAIAVDNQGTGDAAIGADTESLRLGERVEAVIAPSPAWQSKLGVEVSTFVTDVSGDAPSVAELPGIPSPELAGDSVDFRDRLSELAFAVYGEQVWRPWRFELTAGLRAEYLRYGDVSTWALDPRGVLRYQVSEPLWLKLSTGLFTQPPLPFQLTRETANPELAPSRAWQSGAGLELSLPAALEIDGTFFYSHMWQLTRNDVRTRADAEGNPVHTFFDDDGRGRAYGLELMLRRRVEQGLFGWLSYTLSRSERYVPGGPDVLFFFDQTHVLNLALSYAHDGWTFGARFSLATGRPVADLLDREGGNAVYDADQDGYDAARGRRTRLPTHHQLDLRVDRDFELGPLEGSIFLDLINVYNAKNSEGYQYSYDYSERGSTPGFPFLPTVGIRGVLR
jgi:hypothetical protein